MSAGAIVATASLWKAEIVIARIDPMFMAKFEADRMDERPDAGGIRRRILSCQVAVGTVTSEDAAGEM